MKIFLGMDHRGIELKQPIYNYMKEKGYDVEIINIPYSPDDDYPDFAYQVATNVVKNKSLGILVCGTGIGVSIAANKVKGIKCAKVSNLEEARLARNDDGANILAFGANTKFEEAKEIIDTFINTPISNEERHLRRQKKVEQIEEGIYEY